MIAGNLCRCTGYQNIVKAVERAAELADASVRQVDDHQAVRHPVAAGRGPALPARPGRYVDDVAVGPRPCTPPCCARRTPTPGSLDVDVDDVLDVEGVHAVWTYEDLADLSAPMADPLPLLIPHPTLTHGRTQYALANGRGELRRRGDRVRGGRRPLRRRGRGRPDPGRLRVAAARSSASRPPARRRTSCTRTCPATSAPGWSRATATRRAAIAAAPHTLTLDLTVERSACQPMEGRGTVARWDPDVNRLTGVDLDADLDRRARRGRRQARPRPRPGRRDHARRGRRLRREDQPPVARGAAGPAGGPGAGPAGEVHRGPPRALHLLRPRARPGAPRRGRLRRRRSAARARRDVLARPRRLHAVRPDRPDHHLDPAARALQARGLPGVVRVALHQHRDGHALPRRRAAAGLLRDGADHGRDRGVPRQGPRRGARDQLHPARRVPLRPGADLPGRPRSSSTTPATTRPRWRRSRRWSAGTSSRRSRPRWPRRAGRSASAWPATSRAPASGPTRARTCTSRPRARSRSRPG